MKCRTPGMFAKIVPPHRRKRSPALRCTSCCLTCCEKNEEEACGGDHPHQHCKGAHTHWCKRHQDTDLLLPEQHPGAAGSRHAVSDNLSPVLHVLVSPETRKFVSLTTLPGAVSCGAQLGCGSSPAQGRQRAAIQTMFDSPS